MSMSLPRRPADASYKLLRAIKSDGEFPTQFRIENGEGCAGDEFDKQYVALSGFVGPHSPWTFAAAPELLETLRTVLPSNLRVTNLNVSDDIVIPLEMTMGELRKIAAVIAKAEGQS